MERRSNRFCQLTGLVAVAEALGLDQFLKAFVFRFHKRLEIGGVLIRRDSVHALHLFNITFIFHTFLDDVMQLCNELRRGSLRNDHAAPLFDGEVKSALLRGGDVRIFLKPFRTEVA